MKNRLSSIVAAALIVSATTAFGAVKQGQFSVSPVVGGYSFEGGKQHLHTNMVYGARAGYNFTKAFGMEALFDYAFTESYRNKGKVDMYRYGGDLLYHFMPDSKFVPYIAAGYSGLNFRGGQINRKIHGAGDYGIGAKFFVADNFALRADVRHIIYRFDKTTFHNLEYTLGAYIPFGGAAPAVQPVTPPPAPMPEPAKIVPPAPAAPTAMLAVSPVTIVKSNDAAATLNWTSTNADKCNIEPGIGEVAPQGSRSISPSEDTAYTLTCNGPGGEATSRANIGVTIPPPPAPAPEPAPVVMTPQKAAAVERFCNKPAVITVLFDNDKSIIKPNFTSDLNKLGEFLKDFPKAKGEVSGHTDNVASDKYNLGLSQRRADAVKNYLGKTFSIAPERITSKGYGESKPVADNKTKAGKAKNRRIEANFNCE